MILHHVWRGNMPLQVLSSLKSKLPKSCVRWRADLKFTPEAEEQRLSSYDERYHSHDILMEPCDAGK